MKKFTLTNEIQSIDGVTLYRIKALHAFDNVKAGDCGGWIEHEDNLAQEGICWIYDEARVYGKARVSIKAKIANNAAVYGRARVFGAARIADNAQVFGRAHVYDDAKISGQAKVFHKAQVSNTARVYGQASVFNDAWIYGSAWARDQTQIQGEARVYGRARVMGRASVSGQSHIFSTAQLCGDVILEGKTRIGDQARVASNAHYLTVWLIGQRQHAVTAFKRQDGTIGVHGDGFNITLDQFLDTIPSQYADRPESRDYQHIVALIKLAWPAD
ncbi:hypothetical protein [Candidatus Regiella endosymbiont of Tuberolachnus salignus]|uniref:hypothetical protein n=1 Tax=Candidatus Regiella endosymbiont of Tuberolachnus salignus TaxID=3077956 RepID=UPI0030CDE743